jgi:4-amino-4-deoxy-L-arabinose transferase-like glycosyltransferase
MSRKYLVAALVGAAFLLRLAFVWHFYSHPHPSIILDADNYTTLATALVERGEYSAEPGVPSLDRPPGFPFFIAAFFAVFGVKPLMILFLNVFLSTATCALAYLLGKRLFSPRVGLLTLVFWVVYPYSIYYCGWALRESFITFLVAAELWCLLDWQDDPSSKRAAMSAAVGAAIALTNPVSLILLGLTPLTLLAQERFRAKLRHVAVYYAVLGLLYSPWPLRNYRVFGSPIITNIHGGKQFYQGMLVPPEAFGTPEETRILQNDPDYRHGLDMMEAKDYEGANRWFKRAGWKWVFDHPRSYASIVAYRVVKMWRLVPYERSYSHGYRQIFWSSLLSDGLVIPLALLGMIGFWRRWKKLLPLYATIGFWTAAYVLVFVVIRFRLPAMMPVTVFAAAVIDRAYSRFSPSLSIT